MLNENKAAIAGLLSDKNFGDLVIFNCTHFLVGRVLAEKGYKYHIHSLDLQAAAQRRRQCAWFIRKSLGLFRKIKIFIRGDSYLIDRAELYKLYKREMKKSGLVIVAGGGVIKYKYQNCWLYLDALISAADDVGIPVICNAVGVEGFDADDQKCLVLKAALNRNNVKSITTRDDINTLSNKYLVADSDVYRALVADPAVWASEAYGITAKPSAVIGVGIVRGEIFSDNGIPLAADDVVDIYVGLLNELDRKKLLYQLFTNGLPSDAELADKILDRVDKKNNDALLAIPKTDRELLEIVSGYKGVIAARLHANIISYSLRIPSVGLVWNDKLRMFGEQIGCPERFIKAENLYDAKKVVSTLENAISDGYDEESMKVYKETVKKGLTAGLAHSQLEGAL